MPIVIKNLSHVYMAKSAFAQAALHDISFTIDEGEFLCVIGRTGSGKSTLIQHLNGLIPAQSGKITVDEFDLSDKKQRMRSRSHVGLVFQYPEYQLFEETVSRDVAFGPRNLNCTEDEIGVRVADALALVNLPIDQFGEKSPFDLSGGEKRRAAIAGILAMRSRYLLLDEPMAGLDPMGRQSIIELLNTLRERSGCAIIMVSHSMDEVAKYASRIAVLNEGRLVALDTPKEIFKNPDLLCDIGLDIPQSARLAMALRENGLNLPDGIHTEEELIESLLLIHNQPSIKQNTGEEAKIDCLLSIHNQSSIKQNTGEETNP